MNDRDIGLLGLSYRTAPMELRERLTPSPEAMGELAVRGAVALSTCHRLELYLESADIGQTLREGRRLLAQRGGLPGWVLEDCLYEATGLATARHLFRVAAGLDSMVVGEAQVLGQVRRAWEEAQAGGKVGPLLSHLFPHALRVGKRARTETGLARRPASLGTAALALAHRWAGTLEATSVLVIGGGKMGAELGKDLSSLKGGKVMVASRTYSRAEELASWVSGEAVWYEDIPQTLLICDVVISASGVPHFVLQAEVVRQAMEARSGRPLLLIDLGMPRNIEPEAGRVPGVTLRNVDSLAEAVGGVFPAMRDEQAKAQAIVAEEVERFQKWLLARPREQVLASLGARLEAVRQGELARAYPRLKNLSPEEMATVEALTRSMVKKLLQGPASLLRDSLTPEEFAQYDRLIHRLFLAPGRKGRHGQAAE